MINTDVEITSLTMYSSNSNIDIGGVSSISGEEALFAEIQQIKSFESLSTKYSWGKERSPI